MEFHDEKRRARVQDVWTFAQVRVEDVWTFEQVKVEDEFFYLIGKWEIHHKIT